MNLDKLEWTGPKFGGRGPKVGHDQVGVGVGYEKSQDVSKYSVTMGRVILKAMNWVPKETRLLKCVHNGSIFLRPDERGYAIIRQGESGRVTFPTALVNGDSKLEPRVTRAAEFEMHEGVLEVKLPWLEL